MKNVIIALLVFASGLAAQVPTIPNDTHANVRADMNTSLGYLDSKQFNTCIDATGSTTAYVCTSTTTQGTGSSKAFLFKPQTTNTASATLTVNTVIWTLKKQGASLVAGDLIGGQWYAVMSDGAFWQVMTRVGTDGGGAATNGTSGQGLTSNGGGGFGTPLTMPSQTILGYLDLTSSGQAQINATEKMANKGAASGYAPLNSSSKVPAANTLEAGLNGVLTYAGGTPSAIGVSSTNCVHPDGSSSACSGGGATIPSTTSALKGDGAGNAAAVTGTGSNCVHADGTSAACPGGGGTGNAAAYTAVTFSATPTFTATTNTVSAFSITLTGNVTSSTFAAGSTGQAVLFPHLSGRHRIADFSPWPRQCSRGRRLRRRDRERMQQSGIRVRRDERDRHRLHAGLGRARCHNAKRVNIWVRHDQAGGSRRKLHAHNSSGRLRRAQLVERDGLHSTCRCRPLRLGHHHQQRQHGGTRPCPQASE